jgi:hypothetical protein
MKVTARPASDLRLQEVTMLFGVGGRETCIVDTRCRIAIHPVDRFYRDRDSNLTTSAATLFEEAGF